MSAAQLINRVTHAAVDRGQKNSPHRVVGIEKTAWWRFEKAIVQPSEETITKLIEWGQSFAPGCFILKLDHHAHMGGKLVSCHEALAQLAATQPSPAPAAKAPKKQPAPRAAKPTSSDDMSDLVL
jgi:hypothetical protein